MVSIGRRASTDEAELVRQRLLLDQPSLIALEGIEDVVAERQIACPIPSSHALALQDAGRQVFDVDLR
jgi:hypothetical protein